ncbi:hypothetical protein H0H93_011590, partial [Arthromyces matolae]
MDNQPPTTGLDAQIQRILERVKPDNIERFKIWLGMPKVVAKHPIFDAQNAVNWVPRRAYGDFIRAGIGRSAYKPVKSTCIDVSSGEESTYSVSSDSVCSCTSDSECDDSVDSKPVVTNASITTLNSERDNSVEAQPIVRDASQKNAITYIEISDDETEPDVLPTSVTVKQPEYIVISDDEVDQEPKYIVISDNEDDPRTYLNP